MKQQNVLILGADGYLGWPLAMKFSRAGYTVYGMDAGWRRRWVEEVGSASMMPIDGYVQRAARWLEKGNDEICLMDGEMSDPRDVRRALVAAAPDVIVHLAEQPSAPFSMMDAEHAVDTQYRNVAGNLHLLWLMKELCPDAHLIKLATMGEYGVPNVDIPEGVFDLEYRGRRQDGLPFPKQPGSFYHLSKVFDTQNIEAVVRWGWGLTFTNIMQGPVYGVWTDEMQDEAPRLDGVGDVGLVTRLDYDDYFGTVINRFVVQTLAGHEMTVYGTGGQTRGYLTIRDSMEAILTLAQNPPAQGTCRTVNQFVDFYSVNHLAEVVKAAGEAVGMAVPPVNIENPRVEAEEHYYNPDCEILPSLGWKGTALEEGIPAFLKSVLGFAHRIKTHVFMPRTQWR